METKNIAVQCHVILTLKDAEIRAVSASITPQAMVVLLGLTLQATPHFYQAFIDDELVTFSFLTAEAAADAYKFLK